MVTHANIFLMIVERHNQKELKRKAVAQRCSIKKVLLEISQNSQENTCARVSFLIKLHKGLACNFIKKETLAQVFSCEFCQISKNTFFIERLCWMLLLKSLWIYQKVSDILKSGCGSSRPCRFYQKVISKSFVKLTGKCLPWNPNFSKLEVLVNQNNVWNLFNVNNKDNDIFIFILNFEPISHIVLEFLLLTLNK